MKLLIETFNSDPLSYEFDSSTTLRNVIARVLATVDPGADASVHGLRVKDTGKYFTEEEFSAQIVDSVEKVLVVSDQCEEAVQAAEKLSKFLHAAPGSSEATALKRLCFDLADHLKVDIFAEEFISNGGMEGLLNVMKYCTTNSTIKYALVSLSVAMLYANGLEYIKSTPGVLFNFFDLIRSENTNVSKEAVALLFVFCEFCDDGFELVNNAAIEHARRNKTLPYQDVVKLLETGYLDPKLNSLTLLNVMLQSAPDDDARERLLKMLEDVGVKHHLEEQKEENDDWRTQIHHFRQVYNKIVPPSYAELKSLETHMRALQRSLDEKVAIITDYQKHQRMVEMLRDELIHMKECVKKAHEHGYLIRCYAPPTRLDQQESPAAKAEREDLLADLKELSRDKLAEAEMEVSRLTVKLDSYTKERSSLLKRITQYEADLVILEDMETRLQDSTHLNQELEEKYHSLLNEKLSMSVELQTSKLNLQQLQRELSELKSKYDALQAESHEKIRRLSVHPPANNTLQDENKRLKEQIAEFRTQLESLGTEVRSTRALSRLSTRVGSSGSIVSRGSQRSLMSPKGSKDVPAPPPAPPAAPPIAPPVPPAPPGVPAPPGIPSAPGVPAPPGAPPAPGVPVIAAPVKPERRRPSIHPAMPMKRLHWKPIRLPVKKETDAPTLWDNLDEVKDLNWGEFELHFAQKVVHKKASIIGKENQEASISRPKKKVVQRVLDAKRSNAVAIMLKQMPSLPAIQSAIITMDEHTLSLEALENMRSLLPTTQELELIDAIGGHESSANWDVPERYFVMLSGIPRLTARLEVWHFSRKFDDYLAEITSSLSAIRKACEELTSSKELVNVLELVVACGNHMNGGTAKGQADGFDITFLPKIVGSKDNTNRMTLLQYIAELALKRSPNARAIKEELRTVAKAGDFASMQELETKYHKLESQFDDMKLKMKAVGNSSLGAQDKFNDRMNDFLEYAQRHVDDLMSSWQSTQAKFEQTVKYFSGPGAHDSHDSAEFFQYFSTFLKQYEESFPKQEKPITQAHTNRKHQIGQKIGKKGKGLGMDAIIRELRSGKKGLKSTGPTLSMLS